MDEHQAMEARKTSPTYQTLQRRAHGDTAPGFPTRALVDEDPSRMAPADPDPGEDQS